MTSNQSQKEQWPGQSGLLLRLKSIFFKLPLVGEIGGRYFSPPLKIENTAKFGKSFAMPSVLKIVIDERHPIPGEVGKLVNDRFFKDEDTLFFNVSFACGKGGLFEKGTYTDPLSHWFNVFFGYYEINAVIASENDGKGWPRPFGYEREGGDICFMDLIKIGKSDWNYFSNRMYGVPLAEVEKNNGISLPPTTAVRLGTETIGKHEWDVVEVDKFDVVSAYVTEEGRARIENASVFSPIWRMCYGNPHPRPGFDECFFPTNMKAKFYVRTERSVSDEVGKYLHEHGRIAVDRHPKNRVPVYSTYIFGGTINHNYETFKEEGRLERAIFNEEFLEEQLKSARKVMAKYF